jgi:hypothetical protein
MKMNNSAFFASGVSLSIVLAAAGLMSACRGQPSEDPPIHPNLNMDFQTKYRPQKKNEFFEDGRAMREPVAGTIAQGQLKEDSQLHLGKSGETFVNKIPMPITQAFVERGRERYDI